MVRSPSSVLPIDGSRLTRCASVGRPAVLTIVALCAVAAAPAEPNYLQQVTTILATPQTYGNEARDRLIALGPDAVPAIGAKLVAGVEFPMVLVQALSEIGDPRGAEPVLSFIYEQAPYDSRDRSYVTVNAIQLLGAIANPVACDPLERLRGNETVQINVRLAAAGSIARLCPQPLASAAADFIFELYADRTFYMQVPNEGFTQGELYAAIAGVEDDEAAAIMVGLLAGFSFHPTAQLAVDYAARHEGAEFTAGLLRVARDPDFPPDLRIAAADALIDRTDVPSGGVQALVDELLTDVSVYGPGPLLEAAQALHDRL